MAGNKVLTRDRAERMRQMHQDGAAIKRGALEDIIAEKSDRIPISELDRVEEQSELDYLESELEEVQAREFLVNWQEGAVAELQAAYSSGILIGGEEPNHYSFVCSRESGYSEEQVRQAANGLVEDYAQLGFDSMVAESRQDGELMIEVAPKVPAQFQGKDLFAMTPEELSEASYVAELERPNSEVPSDHPGQVSAKLLEQKMVMRS